MSQANRLFELQQVEQSIQSRQKLLEEFNLRIAANKAFEQAASELAVTKKNLTDLEAQYRDLDMEAEGFRGNIAQINEKLYGGRIKNPKELVSFEQEAEMLKSSLRKKDDTLLELMEKIEACKADLVVLRDKFSAARIKWDEEKEELGKQTVQIKKELGDLVSKRGDLINVLDRDALGSYESIKGRRGMAVVKVEQGRCLGCRVSLSVSELQRVRGENIVVCSNCGRILYLS